MVDKITFKKKEGTITKRHIMYGLNFTPGVIVGILIGAFLTAFLVNGPLRSEREKNILRIGIEMGIEKKFEIVIEPVESYLVAQRDSLNNIIGYKIENKPVEYSIVPLDSTMQDSTVYDSIMVGPGVNNE